MSDLKYDVAGAIATITLSRPHRRNAFTLDMVDRWAESLASAQEDDAVRVIVVTGEGGSFCAGVDLDEFDAEPRTPLQEKQLLSDRVHQVPLQLQHIDKPVIAAVSGPAFGAGMDMALLCDLRIAGRSARFSESYVRAGLVPGDGGCWLLPRVVGTSMALKLLWTGDIVDAEEALRIGLVDEVHDDDSLTAAVTRLARRLAAQPPLVLQLIKRAVRQGADHDLPTALDLISSHMAVVRSTDEARRAMANLRRQLSERA